MAFTGFSTTHLVALPPELFTEVLPAITLPSELKITLHVFYRLNRQRGAPRRVSWDELQQDDTLQQGLRSISALVPPDELLAEGLDAAVRRTTLLVLPLPGTAGRTITWYVANTAPNRTWIERVTNEQLALIPTHTPMPTQRPPLIALYEQNIGVITPIILEELRDAEARFSYDWIATAMREAMRSNVRSWRYIQKVLENWATHGRKPYATHTHERPTATPIDISKYTDETYGGLFRRGSDDSDISRS